MAQCTVKSRRETQDALHILASCSSDIMLSNVQFSLRFLDDNSLTRFFSRNSRHGAHLLSMHIEVSRGHFAPATHEAKDDTFSFL